MENSQVKRGFRGPVIQPHSFSTVLPVDRGDTDSLHFKMWEHCAIKVKWVGKIHESPFSTNGKKGNTAPWTLLLFNCWWIELMLDRSGKGVARSTIKILSDVLSFHSQLLVRTDYFFLLSALVSSAVIWRWTLPHRIIEQFKWDECAFQSPRDQNLTNY